MGKMSRSTISSEIGFTLVEIIVVIVILGVLTATFGSKVFSSADRANADITKMKMERVKQSALEFRLRYMKTPHSMQDLTSCTDLTGSGCTPLMDKDDTLDAWGTEMRFESGGGRNFTITSLGADGQAGGDGVDGDIVVKGP